MIVGTAVFNIILEGYLELVFQHCRHIFMYLIQLFVHVQCL